MKEKKNSVTHFRVKQA